MSADFWAGYISGAVGIIIGNPLDILKVRLQASQPLDTPTSLRTTLTSPAPSTTSALLRPFLAGTAAPVLGYGALNALLFVSYNRAEAALNATLGIDGGTGAHLGTTWAAGAVGGLATWAVSTPTELVKCRAQLASPPISSWAVARQVVRRQGLRGLYSGGVVTALRDSIGYGFYFWSYELTSRWMASAMREEGPRLGARGDQGLVSAEAARIVLCGGLAGIVTWVSIFPLDVIKTRVQTQTMGGAAAEVETERSPLAAGEQRTNRPRMLGAWEVAKETYREGGIRPFFRGLSVCSARAFIVNAFQWAVYEWIMLELGQGRGRRTELEAVI